MNPLQVLQGVHAKVKGRGCTERLTRRGRGQGEVKIVCVAAEVSVCVGGGRGRGKNERDGRCMIAEYVYLCIYMYITGFISRFHTRKGKHIIANFKGGANPNPWGDLHITYYRESQSPRGGKSTPPLKSIIL